MGSSKEKHRYQQTLESSESSQNIECLTLSSSIQRSRNSNAVNTTVYRPKRRCTAPSSSARSKLPANAHTSESVDLNSDDDFVEIIPKQPESARKAATSRKCPANSTDSNVSSEPELALEEVEVVNEAPTNASKRVRLNRENDLCFLPSSPSLLRASSPTIRRFNSCASQNIVLAEDSQLLDDDHLFPVSLAASADTFSCDTLADSYSANNALLSTTGGACSASTITSVGSADMIQKSTPRSASSAAPVFSNSGASSNRRAGSAELSSDPISEFLTPTDSPENQDPCLGFPNSYSWTARSTAKLIWTARSTAKLIWTAFTCNSRMRMGKQTAKA
ncbi:hypothetical protein BX070DRAFT_24873 [Coemansia spiralis]|nr:hypothetical protein BX070DRAFT_24873 [Coemansia spiralis]